MPGPAAFALVAAAGWVRLSSLAVLALLAVAGAVALRRPVRAAPPTAMPFLAHIEELRRRLVAAAVAVVLGVAFALSFRWVPWHGASVPVPSLYDPMAAQLIALAADHAIPPGVRLLVTRPTDAVVAELWVAVAIGLAVAMPAVLAQLGGFLAPALRPAERRLLWRAVAPAALLFAAGAAFAFAWVLPVTFRVLYAYADGLGAATFIGVTDFASFTFGFLLAFGLAFQLPLLLHLLARVGLFHWRTGLRHWRHATVAIVVASASLTPDASPVTLALLAVPLAALYAAGVALAWWGGRRREASPGAR